MSQLNESSTNVPANSEDTRYFNEYASGIGYLNRIREFDVEGKPTRFAAQVSVIQGHEDKVHYEHHDLVVASDVVLGVVMEHRAAIEDENSKVIIRFNMANPRAKAFIYKQGERAGEMGATISGFLTRIMSLKINGELVYEDTRTFDGQGESRQIVNG